MTAWDEKTWDDQYYEDEGDGYGRDSCYECGVPGLQCEWEKR